MAERSTPLSGRIAAALPFVLPVLGGLLGVVYVNLNPKDLINPVIAIGGGAVIGWAVSRGILRLTSRRR